MFEKVPVKITKISNLQRAFYLRQVNTSLSIWGCALNHIQKTIEQVDLLYKKNNMKRAHQSKLLIY